MVKREKLIKFTSINEAESEGKYFEPPLRHYYICITAINRSFASLGRLERVCWRREP